MFIGTDWTELSITYVSQYYAERTGMRRKYAKLSTRSDILQQQIICRIEIRQSPYKTDNINFIPIITRTSDHILSVIRGYKQQRLQ